ncbi:homoprotocatechuate degradation operon regulator HpaR [uncultured Pelagimonas sp.]|uniref:homoprotocatechuate degradation operon regulator HpaR n=1 Tax=uncultured Pelagimonas sp. TaxID=1618102 RepID=UPI0026124F08|nr:homoprotocatechuate degradation operon regulator HpaR [uncultured Pelagimonas sp.]
MADVMTGKPKLPPTSRSLPISLIRARESIMAPIRKILVEDGITEQQWRVLRVVSEAGSIDATEVSERASLLLPSLTRIVRAMTEKGLITRAQDPSDRRRQNLAITPAGQEIIDRNLEQVTLIMDGFRDRLGDERHEALIDALNALCELE